MHEESVQRRLPNIFRVQVRWADIDVNRHVNNAAYFTFFEQSRIDWLKRVGMQTTALGEGPVVAQTSCNYRIPILLRDAPDVRMHSGPPGRTSFPTYAEIIGAGRRVIHADGQAIMVQGTNRASGRSASGKAGRIARCRQGKRGPAAEGDERQCLRKVRRLQ
ncbi:MAG: acyl-CoA thioesterase [Burkholderiales bacterium]|nr:acyl-CoA thioesterase [Burkholderiales bacterium]